MSGKPNDAEDLRTEPVKPPAPQETRPDAPAYDSAFPVTKPGVVWPEADSWYG